MSFDTAWELLHGAVLELATSNKPPRVRLVDAVAHHLSGIDPAKHIGDQETRVWYGRLMQRLGATSSRSRPFSAAIAELSDEQVDETLIEIISLYDEITRQDAARPLARAA